MNLPAKFFRARSTSQSSRKGIFLVAGAAMLAACGGPSAPRLNFSGNWKGRGTDSQGADSLVWILTQSGNNLTGSVTTRAADPNDGSCASCHKNKVGLLTGTVTDGNVVVTMTFASGGDVPTPMCSVTMNATGAATADTKIIANYSGGDSCEGPFLNGAFTMVKSGQSSATRLAARSTSRSR